MLFPRDLPCGFSPECMRRCVLSELDVLKPFPQTEQTCGFSPANQLVKVIDKLIIDKVQI